MKVYLESTIVNANQTLAELQELLSRRGASSILVDYEDGSPSGLAFKLKIHEQHIPFRLPCRWQSVMQILRSVNKKPKKNDTWESWAKKVAWRQILYWIKAQLALIETGMVRAEEVFLPYACMGHKTVYEVMNETKFLQLPAPAEQPQEVPQ